jgi:hypothetical protein
MGLFSRSTRFELNLLPRRSQMHSKILVSLATTTLIFAASPSFAQRGGHVGGGFGGHAGGFHGGGIGGFGGGAAVDRGAGSAGGAGFSGGGFARGATFNGGANWNRGGSFAGARRNFDRTWGGAGGRDRGGYYRTGWNRRYGDRGWGPLGVGLAAGALVGAGLGWNDYYDHDYDYETGYYPVGYGCPADPASWGWGDACSAPAYTDLRTAYVEPEPTYTAYRSAYVSAPDYASTTFRTAYAEHRYRTRTSYRTAGYSYEPTGTVSGRSQRRNTYAYLENSRMRSHTAAGVRMRGETGFGRNERRDRTAMHSEARSGPRGAALHPNVEYSSSTNTATPGRHMEPGGMRTDPDVTGSISHNTGRGSARAGASLGGGNAGGMGHPGAAGADRSDSGHNH